MCITQIVVHTSLPTDTHVNHVAAMNDSGCLLCQLRNILASGVYQPHKKKTHEKATLNNYLK